MRRLRRRLGELRRLGEPKGIGLGLNCCALVASIGGGKRSSGVDEPCRTKLAPEIGGDGFLERGAILGDAARAARAGDDRRNYRICERELQACRPSC